MEFLVVVSQLVRQKKKTNDVSFPIDGPSFFFLVNAIDCFKCVSMNWQNKECDDPFHHNNTDDILEAPCLGGRKGRDGVFPATSCVKIAGYFGNFG